MVIEITPGPNMAYLALISAAHGRRAGFTAVAGIGLGLMIIGVAAAFGMAALVTNSPAVWQALRWAGVGYLLWLAWDAWNWKSESPPTGLNEDIKFFRRGLITNILNPKAALFYVAILPKFISPSPGIFLQTIILTLIYVLIATLIHGAIVAMAGYTYRFISKPKRMSILSKVFSGLLAGIAIWFAISTHS